MARPRYYAPPGTPLWERQTGEGDKAWEAFVIYRDLGPDRSLRQVAKRLERSPGYLEELSRTKGWTERVAAWDAELDRQARKAQVAEITKMRKNHATLAVSMLTKAAKGLQLLPPEDLKAVDISRMVEVASKLERLARGDVGEVVEEREGETTPTVTFYMPDNSRD